MFYTPPRRPETRKLLANRGVSPHLFSIQRFDVTEYMSTVNVPAKEGFVEYNSNKQTKYLIDLLNNPFSKNLTIIAGEFYANKAQAVALWIMRSAIVKRGERRLPYWNYLTGTFHDKLRDDDAFKLRIGVPGLLVLDGLTATSSSAKAEKVHDLSQLYGNIPKVVVCCGVDPIQFARNQLYLKPDGFIYLSERKVIEI